MKNQPKDIWLGFVGKFRPRLIEFTSFKLVKTNKYQYHVNIMHIGKVNKTRYDDPGKPIKQTSFTVKKKYGVKPSL